MTLWLALVHTHLTLVKYVNQGLSFICQAVSGFLGFLDILRAVLMSPFNDIKELVYLLHSTERFGSERERDS